MQVIRDEIPLCADCMIAAVNGDFTGLDYHYGSRWTCQTCTREGTGTAPDRCPSCDSDRDADHGPRSEADKRLAEITAGLERLGPHLVPDFDSETGKGHDEFSRRPCGCCGCKLHGERFDFAILGPGDARSTPPSEAAIPTQRPSIEIFMCSDRGIYLPRDFAQEVKRECLSNVRDEDLETLLKGPDHDCYWDAWDRVRMNATLTAPSTGVKYLFDLSEHTGDLFIVPCDMQWDDAKGWHWPDDDSDDSDEG
jgi:hypothetical protein